MKSFVILLLAAFILHLPAVDNQATYSLLDTSWSQDLDKKREFAKALAESLGLKIDGTTADLQVLQKIIDAKAVAKDETTKLQSLGVAFGDAVAARLKVRWVLVTDEYGTGPVLKPDHAAVHVGALTMISKRVEKCEAVNIQEMFDWVVDLMIEKYGAEKRE